LPASQELLDEGSDGSIAQRRSVGSRSLTIEINKRRDSDYENSKDSASLATAVGLMFMANLAMAQSNGAGGGSAPSAQTAKVKCMGANSCKGNSSCKSAQNDCKGQNACKGKGFVETSSSQECTQKGGTSAAS
jgi:hypothetical protein